MSELGNVVQLVNRLQGACTLLGDNAASDQSLPGLWDLLPSIVVIGGQVRGRGSPASHRIGSPSDFQTCMHMALDDCSAVVLYPPGVRASVGDIAAVRQSVKGCRSRPRLRLRNT